MPPPILLLAAVHSEIDATVRRLRMRWHGDAAHGQADGTPLVAAVTGMGAERAAQRFEHLVAARRPARIVLLGFAGGLDPMLNVGDVLHVGHVLNERGETIDLTSGTTTLLSVDRVVTSPADKRRFAVEHPTAAAIDMETHALAAGARAHNVPLDVLRAITDPIDAALPAAAHTWVDDAGRPLPLAALRWLARHPHQLPALLRLASASRRAARALSDHVAATLV